jgi:hypothetical protein
MFRSIPTRLQSTKPATTTRLRSDPDMPDRVSPVLVAQEASLNEEGAAATAKTTTSVGQEVPKKLTFRQRFANLKYLPTRYKVLIIVQSIIMLGSLIQRFNLQYEAILEEERQKERTQELEESGKKPPERAA